MFVTGVMIRGVMTSGLNVLIVAFACCCWRARAALFSVPPAHARVEPVYDPIQITTVQYYSSSFLDCLIIRTGSTVLVPVDD